MISYISHGPKRTLNSFSVLRGRERTINKWELFMRYAAAFRVLKIADSLLISKSESETMCWQQSVLKTNFKIAEEKPD